MLYDVSSSYFEGRCCPLHSYSYDHGRDRLRIVYGLCTREGVPVSVEVFEGNITDPTTLTYQVETAKHRFGISRVVLVGDRGMITSARIGEDLRPAGLDWVTCLRALDIHALATEKGPLQLSLFDGPTRPKSARPRGSPASGLIVCRNREPAAERAQARGTADSHRTRTRPHPGHSVRRCRRSSLPGAAEIGMAVDAVVNSRSATKPKASFMSRPSG